MWDDSSLFHIPPRFLHYANQDVNLFGSVAPRKNVNYTSRFSGHCFNFLTTPLTKTHHMARLRVSV